MAKATTDGGSNKRKPITPGAPGTKMIKQEVPLGGIGKVVAKTAAKITGKSLTSDEKYAVKFVKNLAKNGKPGDVQKVMDGMSRAAKAEFAKALKKAKTSEPAKGRAPKAAPDAQKVRSQSTGKLRTFKP